MHTRAQQADSSEQAAHPVGTLISVNVGMPNRYWERELGRNDFVNGQFGENFTIEGLSDEEVCIGDRYQIGTAVFEVTQPRVTCYRVGIRMNDPRIPALLVSHRRPGFYFRVLQEGEVKAGDLIVKLASGPEQMTVAEVDGLVYLPGHPLQQHLRALRVPALSPGWQTSFRALLEGEPDGGNAGLIATSPPPAWTGFRRLKVTGIDQTQQHHCSPNLSRREPRRHTCVGQHHSWRRSAPAWPRSASAAPTFTLSRSGPHRSGSRHRSDAHADAPPCETTLIAGTLDYNPDPVEPPADGSGLICCSRPHDDVVLDL